MQKLTDFKAQVQDQFAHSQRFPHFSPTISDGKTHNKHHHIRRSSYPMGGYLKVTLEHFNRLSEMEIFPRYKPNNPHHEKKQRFKRDHSSRSYNNIPYCCFNQCEEEFFC